jgi:NAD(P)-dependent dehydrogenase (short-subunit alcohol dehydrogenase family)
VPPTDILGRRRLLIAGATGLVGTALSSAAAASGMELVLTGRSPDALAALGERLTAEHGTPVHPVVADVTDSDSLDRAVRHLRSSGVDRLDAVVYAVTGYDGRPVSVSDLTAADLRHLLESDVVGALQLIQAVLPLLRRGRNARLVLMSSVAALRGRPLAAHLVAAKAGTGGLALALSADLAPDNIAVATVAPGPIARPGADYSASPVATTTPEAVAAVLLGLAGEGLPVNGRPVVITGDGVGPLAAMPDPTDSHPTVPATPAVRGTP